MEYEMISEKELDRLLEKEQGFVIDLRSPWEYAAYHIPGAVNIPLDGSRGEYKNLPKDKTIVVFCAIGLRGYIVARVLMQLGYEVMNLNGGYRTYATVTASAPVNPHEVPCSGPVGKK